MFTPLALHAAAKMHPVGCGKTIDVDREVPKASSEQSPRKRPLSSSDLASRKRSARATVLKIVSATYGPSESRRLILLWLRLLKSGEWDWDKAVEFFRRAFKFKGKSLRVIMFWRDSSTSL